MRFWLRKKPIWLVLALVILSLPGPASKTCACARMSTDAPGACGTNLDRRECPRCALATTSATHGMRQLSRPSCCKAKVADVRAAATPARVQIEPPESRSSLPAAVAPARTIHSERPRSTRAPPPGGTRDSAAPPASYLSDYLRL